MDKLKLDIYQNKDIKNILTSIEEHLSSSEKLSILVTSSTMSKVLISLGIEKLFNDKLIFFHTLGCVNCYTSKNEIDYAIELAQNRANVLLIKQENFNIFGTNSSFKQEKDFGAHIFVIQNEMDCIQFTKDFPDKQIYYFSAGFESNTPSVAGLVIAAKERRIKNLKVLLTDKLLPPALKNLFNKPINIDGYLAPGDLTILIGMQSLEFIPKQYDCPVVVSGFEPLEVLHALETVIKMKLNSEYKIVNSYSNLVNNQGNPLAQEKTYFIFTPKTVNWYGYGLIPFSGLGFQNEFKEFDGLVDLELTQQLYKDTGCICREVLSLKSHSFECPLFNQTCTLETPKNSCMALNNGLCKIYLDSFDYNQNTNLIMLD